MSSNVRLMQSAALAALISLTPAALLAQETEEPETSTMEGSEAAEPVDPAETEMAEEMAEEEVPVAPVEGAISLQGENTVLAQELLGSSVYVAGDETAGDINDMIINLDGTVEGVVIGVGGFLGIGEKRVAVQASQLSIQMDENGDPRLLLNATREELEAAPEFTTAEEQRQETEAMTEEPVVTDGAADPALDPAMTETDPAMTEETDPAMTEEEETAPATE